MPLKEEDWPAAVFAAIHLPIQERKTTSVTYIRWILHYYISECTSLLQNCACFFCWANWDSYYYSSIFMENEQIKNSELSIEWLAFWVICQTFCVMRYNQRENFRGKNMYGLLNIYGQNCGPNLRKKDIQGLEQIRSKAGVVCLEQIRH